MRYKSQVFVSRSDPQRYAKIMEYIQHKQLPGEFQSEELGSYFYCGRAIAFHIRGFINGYDVGRGAYVELT